MKTTTYNNTHRLIICGRTKKNNECYFHVYDSVDNVFMTFFYQRQGLSESQVFSVLCLDNISFDADLKDQDFFTAIHCLY